MQTNIHIYFDVTYKVAIKCVDKKNLDTSHLTRLYREIEIMKSLDHQHIIKLSQVLDFKAFFNYIILVLTAITFNSKGYGKQKHDLSRV